MYKNNNEHGNANEEGGTGAATSASASALIDSFFLPGGILDPEENNDTNDANPRSSSSRFNHASRSHSNQRDHSSSQSHNHNRGSLERNRQDTLRSRLDQIAIGGQALEYTPMPSNANANANANVNGDMSSNIIANVSSSAVPTRSLASTSHEPARVGVSALDPTADDIVGVGGTPILIGSSMPIPSSATLHGHGHGHGHGNIRLDSRSHSGQMPLHSRQNTETIRDYNSDWFSSNQTTTSPATQVHTHAHAHSHSHTHPTTTHSSNGQNDDLAQFLRGALHSHAHAHNQTDILLPMSSPTGSGVGAGVHGNVGAPVQTKKYHTETSFSTSSKSNESRTTSATSHVRRNPWSNEDLSNQQHVPVPGHGHGHGHGPSPGAPSHLQFGSRSPNYSVAVAVPERNETANPSSLGNFQPSNPLATSERSVPHRPVRSSMNPNPNANASANGTNISASRGQGGVSVSVRPPPGFLSSSSTPVPPPVATQQSRSAPQQQHSHSQLHSHSHSHSHLRPSNHDQGTGRSPKQLSRSPQAAHNASSSPYHRHGHGHGHGHNRDRDRDMVNILQQNNRQAEEAHVSNVQRKNKAAHHNDGDYDLSSLNTKSSRDIPSTIYVEEDAVSTSEDTLTVCADSSVTDVSVQKTSTKIDNERTCMDVLEETSAIEQKRNKPKRNKKKKAKKKHNSHQGSVKSQDNSAHDTVRRTTTSLDEKEHKSDSEDESKETKRTARAQKKSQGKRKGSGFKSQSNSRSSAATTANTSTATTAQRTTVKRNQAVKASHHDKNQGNVEERRSHREAKPREPFSVIMRRFANTYLPTFQNVSQSLGSFTNISSKTMKFVMKALIALFPRKERFWFLLPAFCVIIDFCFLASAMVCKALGQLIYAMVLVHKLALLELMESDSAAICYTVIYFYPNIVSISNDTIPYQDYWPVFLRWLAVDRWLCRPISMKDTYLYRLKKCEEREMNIVKLHLVTGSTVLTSISDAVSHILRLKANVTPEDSERVTMANHILLILRKMTPLILMLEVNIRREGFLVLMTSTERILFGYGFAVLRSGYLFSPLIWISWTVQLTIIMFVLPSSTWSYFIFVIGLVSIRLSHYTAAVEDLEGINGTNRHSTSRYRKKARERLKAKE